MEIRSDRTSGVRRAFSRVDLIAVIAIVALVAGWLAINHMGERGRIVTCANNLRKLGQAIDSEADDHSGGLIPAELDAGKVNKSWDTDLFPYLNPSLGKASDADSKALLLESESERFHCPSDTIARRAPRSYTMPAHDMARDWPPTSNDSSGVGIYWDKPLITSLLGADAWANAMIHPEDLPRLKVALIPDPAQTLQLTELIALRNVIKHTDWARVANPQKQQNAFQIDLATFHSGKMNHLMVDGHVELLSELQAGELGTTPGGIWTIKAGD